MVPVIKNKASIKKKEKYHNQNKYHALKANGKLNFSYFLSLLKESVYIYLVA
jgi:hypothetical protein